MLKFYILYSVDIHLFVHLLSFRTPGADLNYVFVVESVYTFFHMYESNNSSSFSVCEDNIIQATQLISYYFSGSRDCLPISLPR